MPAPSFTGALAVILCSARLSFDLVSVYYKPDRIEPALRSAYHFADVLSSVTDEATCPTLPPAGEERASEKLTSPDSVVIFLCCAVGLLGGSCICLCICLRRRRRRRRFEVQPYTPLVSGSDGMDARRARNAADEGCGQAFATWRYFVGCSRDFAFDLDAIEGDQRR